ncbi:MAG TPA: UDP-glucose 4-epimerase GalE [Chloroflexota bacterium]|nr:UDP-glucose 4-epimerase GalE [Chloroflexota bacterium]
MNVLVTGGAGYIGSVIVEFLIRQGHAVAVLDSLYKGHAAAVTSSAKLITADLADLETLKRALDAAQADAVVHMAADSLVGESMTNPAKYFRNNVVNSQNLVDAMLASGVQRLVFSSTAAVYGEPETVPITEDLPLAPTNVYGETKLAFERMLGWYDRISDLRWIALRYFNAAGATDAHGEDHNPESHLIPIVLQVPLGKRESVQLFGTDYPTEDGTCIRDYIHVADLADAHIKALEALAPQTAAVPSGAYNLGNGTGYSNRQVIEACRRVTGDAIPVVEAPRRPGDPAALVASSERIRRDLGWTPRYPEIEQIVDSAWRWHRQHPSGYGA